MSALKNLRNLRKERGLTQEWLAKQAGLTQPYVAILEGRYSRNPSLSTVRRIAAALGVTISELVGEIP